MSNIILEIRNTQPLDACDMISIFTLFTNNNGNNNEVLSKTTFNFFGKPHSQTCQTLIILSVNDFGLENAAHSQHFAGRILFTPGFLLRVGTRLIYPAMAVLVHGYRRGRPIFFIPRVG